MSFCTAYIDIYNYVRKNTFYMYIFLTSKLNLNILTYNLMKQAAIFILSFNNFLNCIPLRIPLLLIFLTSFHFL